MLTTAVLVGGIWISGYFLGIHVGFKKCEEIEKGE